MDALTTLPVRRVPFSADIEKPGDFCFIEKRAPKRTFEPIPLELPKGFWAALLKLIRLSYSPKQAYKEIVEIVWPDYD